MWLKKITNSEKLKTPFPAANRWTEDDIAMLLCMVQANSMGGATPEEGDISAQATQSPVVSRTPNRSPPNFGRLPPSCR